jgi:hypothetical protein
MELQNLLLVNYELWGSNLTNKRMTRKGFHARVKGLGNGLNLREKVW